MTSAPAQTQLTICATCADTSRSGEDGLGGGAALHQMIKAHLAEHPNGDRIALKTQRCLMACAEGCVASVAGRGKMQYLLGRMPVDPALVEQIVDFAALYDAAPTGVAPNHLWPPRMALHFLGRIPPTDPVAGDWSQEGCDL